VESLEGIKKRIERYGFGLADERIGIVEIGNVAIRRHEPLAKLTKPIVEVDMSDSFFHFLKEENKIIICDVKNVLKQGKKFEFKLINESQIKEIIINKPAVVIKLSNDNVYKAVSSKEHFDAEKGLAIALNKMMIEGFSFGTSKTQYQKLLKLMNQFNKAYFELVLEELNQLV